MLTAFRCRTNYFSVTDDLLPSGPWVGFYSYHGESGKHRMDLGLTFTNGIVSGEGNDDIGAFIIRGHYDVAAKECYWTKTYVGAHDVYYRGFREGKGKGIWGTWEIFEDAHGGFQIWPRAAGEGEGEGDTETVEKEEPVEAAETMVNG